MIARPLWLPLLYIYLDVSETPKSADVIVVLGGSSGEREIYAAELYRQGYAPIVLVSGHSTLISDALTLVEQKGVPEENIVVNDKATTTFDEAGQVLALLLKMNVDSMLVVTDRFHTRRASATYRQVFHDHGIEVRLVSPDEKFDAAIWWQSSLSSQILMEYPKMLYYWLAYGIWSG